MKQALQMKKKKDNKNKAADHPVNDNNIVSDPEVIYGKRDLKSFTSFEEMNEEDAKEMAALSPMTHLQHATLLIKKMYEDELKKPMNKKIKFT